MATMNRSSVCLYCSHIHISRLRFFNDGKPIISVGDEDCFRSKGANNHRLATSHNDTELELLTGILRAFLAIKMRLEQAIKLDWF